MGQRERGLYNKFTVGRSDGRDAPGEKHANCDYFVLDLTHDPHALPAILAYAKSARADGYVRLADDLERKAGDRMGRCPKCGGVHGTAPCPGTYKGGTC